MKSDFYLERLGFPYSIRLEEGVNKIGRVNCDIRLSTSFSSRNHCDIIVNNDKVEIIDHSSNGTYVNEIQFDNSRCELKVTDKIGIGVTGVDHELDKKENYHVYVLKKIVKEEVICISDDESQDIFNSYYIDDSIESQRLSASTIPEVILETPAINEDYLVCNNIETVNSSNLIPTNDEEENALVNNNDSEYEEVEKTKNVDENAEIVNENLCSYTNRLSLIKVEEEEITETHLDQHSEMMMSQMKEEMAELDLTESQWDTNILKENLDKNEENKLIDFYDLTSDVDEDDEDDEVEDNKTRQWYMKLSQTFDNDSYGMASNENDDVFNKEKELKKSQTNRVSYMEPCTSITINDLNKDDVLDVQVQKLTEEIKNKKPNINDEVPNILKNKEKPSVSKEVKVSLKSINRLDFEKSQINRVSYMEPSTSMTINDINDDKVQQISEKSKYKKPSTNDNVPNIPKEKEKYKENRKILKEESSSVANSRKSDLNNINKPNTSISKKLEESLKSINSLKRRNSSAFIIPPPTLPAKRGKLRGISAEPKPPIVKSPEKYSKRNKEKRTREEKYNNTPQKCISKIKKKEQEEILKEKWLRKPDSSKEKSNNKKLKDERKQKLKDLAEMKKVVPEKRKLNDEPIDSNPPKSTKHLRVKVTERNRGAFLQESIPISNRRKSCDISENNIKETVYSILKRRKSCDHSQNYIQVKESVPDRRKSTDMSNEQTNNRRSSRSSLRNETSINSCNQDVEIPPEKLSFRNIVTYHSSNIVSPKIDKSNKIKSCFKKSVGPNQSKKVRFNDKVTTFFIEREEEAISMPQNNFSRKDTQSDTSSFDTRKRLWKLRCPIQYGVIPGEILSDILAWKFKWFDSGYAEVVESSLLPMFNSYKSFDDYKKNVFNLMKLELWERVLREKNKNYGTDYSLHLEKFEIDEKSKNKRIYYDCQYDYSSADNIPLFFVSELVLIKVANMEPIFGYVRNQRCLDPNSNSSSKHFWLQLESNIFSNIRSLLRYNKNLKVTKLTLIATELGAFEAVKYLEHSPLVKEILDPSKLIEPVEIRKEILQKTVYNGYDKLNDIQEDILKKTYIRNINTGNHNVTLIEGPPGTGKSKLIVNLSLQSLYGHEVKTLDRKILICAHSNAAIDVIAQKLIHIRKKMNSKKYNLVRYGVESKMHPDVKPYSLTQLSNLEKNKSSLTSDNDANMLQRQRNHLENQIKVLEKKRRSNSIDDNNLEKMKKELNLINQRSYLIHRNVENLFLSKANIVCTTLSSCVRLLRNCSFFDVCIVDEATQCCEPWTLIPLQFGINSLILVGDTQQLPATTLSKLTKKYNFGKSYFTRVQETFSNEGNYTPIMSLRTQYRMHPEISKWPNLYFYRDLLKNDTSTTQFECLVKPYTVFELNFSQNKTKVNGKISNCSEADFIVKLVQHLFKVMPTDKFSYGIISPYSEHCNNLRDKLFKQQGSKECKIEVDTIDSYQGKEKDVIIISNARTEGVGFLNEICRLNVALTRAKKCLILCGNFSQLENLQAWKSLLVDAKRREVYFNLKSSDDFVNLLMK